MSQYILGLDIGGTKSAAIIGTADGEVLSRNPSRRRNSLNSPQTVTHRLRLYWKNRPEW